MMADNRFDPLNPLGNPEQVLDLGYGRRFFPNSGESPFFYKGENIPALSFEDTIRGLALNALPSENPPDLSSSEKLTKFVQDWVNGHPSPKAVEGMVENRKKDPEFTGYFRGFPVYTGKGATDSTQGSTKNSTIALNPLMAFPVGDVIRHESGHAMAQAGFPETPQATTIYGNIMKALDEANSNWSRNKSATNAEAGMEAYQNYLKAPQEQAANWIGGLYGSWSNEPSENPPLVNTLFDWFYKLGEENQKIENMFRTSAVVPKKTAGQVP